MVSFPHQQFLWQRADQQVAHLETELTTPLLIWDEQAFEGGEDAFVPVETGGEPIMVSSPPRLVIFSNFGMTHGVSLTTLPVAEY